MLGMEFQQLRYVLAVAETRHFTRAAQRLYVAQSALSQQVAKLEAEIGAALFVRSSRRVELTLKRLVGGEYAFSYTQRRLIVRDLQMVGENLAR